MKRWWIVLLLACSEPDAEDTPPADSSQITHDTTSQQTDVISTRTVLFMVASTADMDSLRKKYSEEDFAVVADDGMYYRATAFEYLETVKLPVTTLDGRRPVTFLVNGAPRTYDFKDIEWLDVIVLYDKDREPRMIAPVDVHSAVEEYYGIPAPRN